MVDLLTVIQEAKWGKWTPPSRIFKIGAVPSSSIGWFSNQTGTSVDDGARKSNNWLDQWLSGKLCTGSRDYSYSRAFPTWNDVPVLLLNQPLKFSLAQLLFPVNRELKQQQRQRLRLRKRHSTSEVALLQTLSRLFHLVQFIKCLQFFLELNSK